MDYFGYKLANSYNELTWEQALFLDMGRCELEKEMNGNDDKAGRGAKVRPR